MFSAIFAVSKNRVIGKDGKLPWYIPEDFKIFKEKTLGQRIIMGRKTFDSLGQKPLKDRENIVLTNRHLSQEGVVSFSSYEQLLWELEKDKNKKNIVIGGAEIFVLFLPRIEKIYLSYIPQNFAGDVFFPPFETDFEKISEKKIAAKIPFFFQTWVRKEQLST